MNSKQRVYAFFWIFGLVNNVLYVVILSAAVDIVGPKVPKTLVLLMDITPSLLIKVTAPFFIKSIPYTMRIYALIALSCIGMIFVSGKSLLLCMIGIAMASVSSGFGEVSFLQLSHFFEENALNGWSSGTGGAGIVGSSVYMLLTSIFKLPIRLSLLSFTILPFAFLLYFKLDTTQIEYDSISSSGEETLIRNSHSNAPQSDTFNESIRLSKIEEQNIFVSSIDHFKSTCVNLKALVVPYMLPLSSVYLFEYLINQAVSPTLLFPLDSRGLPPFFNKYRDMYVTYGTLYQLGVFISRSLAHKFRMHNLYFLSALQGLNLVLTILQAWIYIVHTPWPIMILIFYEGLLGGSSYVNTFLNVLEEVDMDKREFSLGAVSIADSLGVFIAALVGLGLEPTICNHQVSTGRPWCTME